MAIESNDDIETGQEVPVDVTRSRRFEGPRKGALGKKFVCGIITVATVLLVVGLSVGLTQSPSDEVDSTASPLKTENSTLPRPVIVDTDYGAFPDDVFALGLALELEDIMDVKAVVATSMDPGTSAQCIAQHSFLAGKTDIHVIVGKDIHDAPFRAGIWINDDLVGFPLREKCESNLWQHTNTSLGDMEELATMLTESDRTDWAYIALGGTTTIAALTKEYPNAVAKIEDMIVMGSNICDEMDIYVGIPAPVQGTNTADTLEGEPYQRIIQAAEKGTCPGAAALLEFYFEWHRQVLANENLITYDEAISNDPNVSSALRYDPTAILYAAQLLTKEDLTDDHVTHVEIPEGLWFDSEAYTYIANDFDMDDPVSDTCPSLTDLKFDPDKITDRRPLIAAIGYKSSEDHKEFIDIMANALSCQRRIDDEKNFICSSS